MQGIRFGNYHSYHDFHLILANKTVGTPSPKTETIDIPGGDGVLDLTEYFGDVKYENRPLSYEFSTMVPRSEFPSVFSAVQNALHGRKLPIIDDEDPEWFYTGRISVSEWKAEKNIGKLTIDCDCEPYRSRISSQAVNLCGVNLLNLNWGTPVDTHEALWAKTETGYAFTRGSISGGSFLFFYIPVKKGQTYIFSADYNLTAQTMYVYKDRLYGTAMAIGNPCIFTAEESGRYIFGLYCSSGVTSAVFDNVMVQEGAVKGPYVAYDSTSKEITTTFTNARKSAIPKAFVTGSVSVESPSNYLSLVPGANTLPEFIFKQGETTLTFKGNGIAVVEWKEGAL